MFIHYRVGFEEKSFPILVNFGEACKMNSKKEGKVFERFLHSSNYVDKLLNTDRAIEISDIYKSRDKCDYDLNVNFPSIY